MSCLWIHAIWDSWGLVDAAGEVLLQPRARSGLVREGDTSVLQEGEHMVGLNDGTPCFGKLGRGEVLDVGPVHRGRHLVGEGGGQG